HERECPARQAWPEQGSALPDGFEKNYAKCRNHPATPELILGAGRSPPAPHPQSPGVEPRPYLRPGFLFVGVRSLFVGHSGRLRRGQAERKRASVVSAPLA